VQLIILAKVECAGASGACSVPPVRPLNKNLRLLASFLSNPYPTSIVFSPRGSLPLALPSASGGRGGAFPSRFVPPVCLLSAGSNFFPFGLDHPNLTQTTFYRPPATPPPAAGIARRFFLFAAVPVPKVKNSKLHTRAHPLSTQILLPS